MTREELKKRLHRTGLAVDKQVDSLVDKLWEIKAEDENIVDGLNGEYLGYFCIVVPTNQKLWLVYDGEEIIHSESFYYEQMIDIECYSQVFQEGLMITIVNRVITIRDVSNVYEHQAYKYLSKD